MMQYRVLKTLTTKEESKKTVLRFLYNKYVFKLETWVPNAEVSIITATCRTAENQN